MSLYKHDLYAACSEEQLLAEDASWGKPAQSQASAAQQHTNGNHVFMQYQTGNSQHNQGVLSSNAVPSNSHQPLTCQLPASFASMSTSFLSPDYSLSGHLQTSIQTGLNPHDSAWFREGQLASAQQQQQTPAWQQASHGLVWTNQQPPQQQDSGTGKQLLLAAHQQGLLSDPWSAAQQHWQHPAWVEQQQQQEQHQQQLILAAAAAAAGLQQQHQQLQSHSNGNSLQELLSKPHGLAGTGKKGSCTRFWAHYLWFDSCSV